MIAAKASAPVLSDVPHLTDAQERVLIGLENADRDHAVGLPSAGDAPALWHDAGKLAPHGLAAPRYDSRTLATLAGYGLVEVKNRNARITADGLALLKSMGD